MKELATRLFHTLKTDPENFETEASIRRMGPGRRIKAESRILNCNSNNKNNTGIAARGRSCCSLLGYLVFFFFFYQHLV